MVDTDSDRSGRATWLVPAISALAVGAVLLAGAGLSTWEAGADRGGDDQDTVGLEDGRGEVVRATNGRVDDRFTCPGFIPYNFGTGDSPLAAMARDGPRAFAAEMGASRFELEGSPDATVLRLGNADGSLASLNTLHETPDGWVLDDMTVCDGEHSHLAPTRNPGLLGMHGGEPWPRQTVVEGRPGVVFVDDRQYYNVAGVIQHRSLYAYPCVEDICLVSSDGVEAWADGVSADDIPRDLSGIFLPPEPLVDRDPPYAFVAVYDRADRLSAVSWAGDRTGTQPATVVDGPGWTGRLFLVLAPYDEIGTVTLHPRRGQPRDFGFEEIRRGGMF